jgi:putative sterol carrier protein
MPKYLSAEWMEKSKELAQVFPETPGATVRIQEVITGTPDGDVTYHRVIEDGRTVEQALGEDPSADVTLTETYDDAVKMLKGELDANAAFMQGRVKVAGNMAKMMSLLPITMKPEYKQVQADILAATEF